MAEGAHPGAGINWLASYPKSGNTWMRILLANYFAENDVPHDINSVGVTNGIASSRQRFDQILGVSSDELTAAETAALQPHVFAHLGARAATPVWMKVHDARQRIGDDWLFPRHASHAVVYLIRNPLDVAVSFAFHSGRAPARTVDGLCDPGMVIAHRSAEQLPQRLGSWSDHVASWVDQSEIPVCVIRYEDMLADPAGQLTRAIVHGRPDVTIDPARIAHAVDRSRFERLQATEVAHGFRERPVKAQRFFRNGRADGWRDHLTTDQARQVCAAHHATMIRFGYDPDIDPEKTRS